MDKKQKHYFFHLPLPQNVLRSPDLYLICFLFQYYSDDISESSVSPPLLNTIQLFPSPVPLNIDSTQEVTIIQANLSLEFVGMEYLSIDTIVHAQDWKRRD